MNYNLIETKSDDDFTAQSVKLLSEMIKAAIEDHGKCIIGLSGGSTPRKVYEELGKENIDWNNVFVFLTDERFVSPEDESSNQNLLRDTLLLHAEVPEDNLFFPDTSLPIEDCVTAYSAALIQLFSEQPPDIITLGLGSDGHIASLFPPVSEDSFKEVLALHTTTDEFDIHDRISISPLVIMAAQSHILMIKGDEKREVFDGIVESEMNPVLHPLQIALATERVTMIA